MSYLSLVIKAVPGPEIALSQSGVGFGWLMLLDASRDICAEMCELKLNNDLYKPNTNVAIPKHMGY